jgi:predicted hydrolase (HD superfamily)
MFPKINAAPLGIPTPIDYALPADLEQRQRIASLISDYVSLPLAQHLVAVECAMFELAHHFREGEAAPRWALAGLLHDIDWDACKKDADVHCKKETQDWLLEKGIRRELMEDALSHYGNVNGVGFENGSGFPVDSVLRKSLFAVDELCGFIIACALVRPSKSIMDMEASSVLKKFKDKRFAAQVDRNLIRTCETTLSTPLPSFVELALNAMKKYGVLIEGFVRGVSATFQA